MNVKQSFESYESLLAVRDFYTASRLGDITVQINYFNQAVTIFNRMLEQSSPSYAQRIWAEAFGQLVIGK